MGKKDDKNKLALLEKQQAEDRARQQALMTQAATPKPLENTISAEDQNWLDTTSGKNGPIDYSSLSPLNFDLYNRANARQQGERMGTGLLQMGAQGSDSGLTALLRQQSEDQRQQEAAGGFENAVRMKDASVRGGILPLLSLEQNRSLGLAGMASNQSQNSTNAYTQFKPAPSFWSQLLMTGLQGAAGVGAGMATGGTGFFRPK